MRKAIIAIFVITVLIALYILGQNLYKDWIYEREINGFPDYYKQLAEKCSSRGCCLSSVRYMVKGNFKLSPESGCPDDMQGNMLKCIDSYKWCEPKK
jgi:hypothetical protein